MEKYLYKTSWKWVSKYIINNIREDHKKINWSNSCSYNSIGNRMSLYWWSIEKALYTPNMKRWWDRKSKNYQNIGISWYTID
jgi:hypothetical protein